MKISWSAAFALNSGLSFYHGLIPNPLLKSVKLKGQLSQWRNVPWSRSITRSLAKIDHARERLSKLLRLDLSLPQQSSQQHQLVVHLLYPSTWSLMNSRPSQQFSLTSAGAATVVGISLDHSLIPERWGCFYTTLDWHYILVQWSQVKPASFFNRSCVRNLLLPLSWVHGFGCSWFLSIGSPTFTKS